MCRGRRRGPHKNLISVFFFATLALLLGGGSQTGTAAPPRIQSLLKPEVFRRVAEKRDVQVNASLDDAPSGKGMKRYEFYAAMIVRSTVRKAKNVLTDYEVYPKLIPYVKKSEFNPKTQSVRVEGGIFNFLLKSEVRFEDKGAGWIGYRVIGGHFRGLKGQMLFEPHEGSQGSSDTLVYFDGSLEGKKWPPAIAIKLGAEIVLAYTGRRLRSKIESIDTEAEGTRKKTQDKKKGSDDVPKPQRSLPTVGAR